MCSPEISPPRKHVWLFCGLTLLLVLIAFGRTLTQDFAPVDDDLLITHNLAVRGITAENLKTVFTTFDPELYIPLTFVSYQMNFLIGGLHPLIYHLTNILLHAGNAMLVGLLFMMLMRRKGAPWGAPTPMIMAFAGACIFAVHPLNTEAVAWLAGRKDLLSTMFFLLAWILYIFHLRRREHAHMRDAPWGGPTLWYVASIFLFLIALLSKVMAVTLPAILILHDLLIERKRLNVKILLDKIPYVALSGIFLVVATIGKERILSNHTTWETILMAAKSMVFYLQKSVIPYPLGVFYPYRGEISLWLSAFFVPILILFFFLFLLFFFRKNRDVIFGVLFFLITLAPTFINFHKGGEMYFASDRYMYLPMIGLLYALTVSLGFLMVQTPFPKPPPHGRRFLAAMPLLILLFCGLSFQQTKIWDSADTLFGHTLSLYPNSIAARAAIASMEKQRGKYDQAIKLLRDGLKTADSVELRMGLGSVYAKMGRVEDAADQFYQAVKLDPGNPEPLVGLGVLDEYEGRIPAAMQKYGRAVDLDPSYVEARNKLGSLFFEEGKIAEAEEQFRAALKWNPNTEGVLYNLSLILDGQGKREEARKLLEKAHALAPDDPTIDAALKANLAGERPST